MGNYTITPEQIKELETLSGSKIEMINPNKYIIYGKSGKKYSQTPYDLLEKLNHYKSMRQRTINFDDLFKKPVKQEKKEFKTIACCVDLATYNKVKAFADKHEISIHQLLKKLLNEVIK